MWPPRGQTPIIEEKAGREHLSGPPQRSYRRPGPNGRLYLSGQTKAFNSETVIDFLEYLCRRYRSKNLIVIWDGATIHRSQSVKDFLTRQPGRVHLVALPGYSPELNPVELLWNQLKEELKNQVFLNLKDLVEVVVSNVEQIRNDVELLTSFFRKKEVAFFID